MITGLEAFLLKFSGFDMLTPIMVYIKNKMLVNAVICCINEESVWFGQSVERGN